MVEDIEFPAAIHSWRRDTRLQEDGWQYIATAKEFEECVIRLSVERDRRQIQDFEIVDIECMSNDGALGVVYWSTISRRKNLE